MPSINVWQRRPIYASKEVTIFKMALGESTPLRHRTLIRLADLYGIIFMFKPILKNDGWRLMDGDIQFGEYFQRICRSPEAVAALIVYEKYKRKYLLELNDLKNLYKFVKQFSEERLSNNKSCSNDYMVQIASAEIKKYESLKIK